MDNDIIPPDCVCCENYASDKPCCLDMAHSPKDDVEDLLMPSEAQQKALDEFFGEIEDNDLWFLPHDGSKNIIAKVLDHYFLWEDGKELVELIPTTIIVDDSI